MTTETKQAQKRKTYTIFYEVLCQVADAPACIPPGGGISPNPKWGWARKHFRETHHSVLLRKTEEWRDIM